MKAISTLVLWATALAVTGAASAQTPQLQPPEARISDAAIQADHRSFDAVQGRIQALNAAGRPLRDYHLAKAQCWLDVSFHEYTRNDRSPFPQAALTESDRLVTAMAQGQAPLPMDTPLVNGAARLRPDLWARATALRSHAGWRCAQQQAACAEVELVHAGHEFNQQQWRHAQPYVQIAEDLLANAEGQAAACVPAAPPAPPVVPAPAVPKDLPPPAPPAVQAVYLGAEVVFNFDKSSAADIRPASSAQLQALVQRLQRDGLVVEAVQLTGHADRLNSTGQDDYNQRLSERRVATVREVLAALGIAPALISTAARGADQPVSACEQRFGSPADLRECLLPNRRVDVQVQARRR